MSLPFDCFSCQARLVWEARISSKWEAYWAVRRPREEAPAAEATSAKYFSESTEGMSSPCVCHDAYHSVSSMIAANGVQTEYPVRLLHPLTFVLANMAA